MSRHLVWLLVASLPAVSMAQAPRLTKAERSAILADITAYQKQKGMPAISVALAIGDSIVLLHAQGLARIEDQVPATPVTRFRSASTLKALTATLILQQVAQGTINLDGEIHQYCGDYLPQKYPITVRQLLLHQGGVRSSDFADIFTRDHYPTVKSALARFANDSLRFAPGTGQLYSNYGYVLLACAIEGVTGKSYDLALAERLLGPLKMAATGPVNLYRTQRNRASSYLLRTTQNTEALKGVWTPAHLASSPTDTAFPADPIDPSFAVGAGNYMSTPTDMVRFVMALDAGRLIPDSLRQFEATPQPSPAGTTPRPMGWFTANYDGQPVSQVFGSDWNGSFAIVWDPARHVAIAIASNLNWDQPGELVGKLLAVIRR